MEIHFKGTNYELPASVSKYAQRKIGSLKKYVKKSEEVVQVYVELEKEAHTSGPTWRAEINFDLDGALFRAEALEESIEKAIDTTVQELSTTLRRSQKKKQDLARQGGATIKSLLRGFGS
ncbi:ribosome-associated translation inhibitor RaiA [Patescibacteria group bacterium]|nr:ribosome-associated translation inhibitor RaiA [Patescibacteria group bacterium]MBU1501003.1 ribosome-associated translation inhibitor RaiA [Patescibacteria group bacterium]MBU2080633.1 ribosome-associated translation inhibitor RaiA [Patescibacteria group bacterium]MBU2124292.1 ribosome-associated translation inhibitor RaiA [Patescibacteria group bacterium]MBU2194418.1 ribosome-associated translation inhibitor RaiA [Patescibacteria group bacterium]